MVLLVFYHQQSVRHAWYLIRVFLWLLSTCASVSPVLLVYPANTRICSAIDSKLAGDINHAGALPTPWPWLILRTQPIALLLQNAASGFAGLWRRETARSAKLFLNSSAPGTTSHSQTFKTVRNGYCVIPNIQDQPTSVDESLGRPWWCEPGLWTSAKHLCRNTICKQPCVRFYPFPISNKLPLSSLHTA